MIYWRLQGVNMWLLHLRRLLGHGAYTSIKLHLTYAHSTTTAAYQLLVKGSSVVSPCAASI